jgi:4-diphosphocytidyl-2-C-methyl-D-erythritol kinase
MLVTERAHAKINLALHITGRRRDGYHELDSIVAFADVADVLSIAPATDVSISLSGPFANDLPPDGENIVLKAWRLLADYAQKKNFPFAPVKFQLEKNLPVAAGIGGGSADAAAALRGLVQYSNLSISSGDLNNLALRLGADVPICLLQKTSRMRGIGEIIESIDIDLPSGIVLVNPRIPAPTSKVFESLNLQCGQSSGTPISDLSDVHGWRNDLTEPAVSIVAEIAGVLESLGSQENITSSRMSGSGATCFGLAENSGQAERAGINIKTRHPDWWVIATSLL